MCFLLCVNDINTSFLSYVEITDMGKGKAQQITACLCIPTCISSKHYNVDREQQTGRNRKGGFRLCFQHDCLVLYLQHLRKELQSACLCVICIVFHHDH